MSFEIEISNVCCGCWRSNALPVGKNGTPSSPWAKLLSSNLGKLIAVLVRQPITRGLETVLRWQGLMHGAL